MDIYREEILDHYKNPRNSGRLTSPTKSVHEENTMCGDALDLDILVEGNVVKDIRIQGNGCAISVAASSILSEMVKDKSLDEVRKISKEQVLERVNPNMWAGREKCATLSYNALQKAIQK